MINSATVLICVILAIVTFTVKRSAIVVPFIIAACFVPTDQRIIIMGLDFNVLRILVLTGVLRIFIRNENEYVKWHVVDKLLFAWAISGAVIYTLQYMTFSAAINRSGVLFDLVGMYWIFRHTIRTMQEVKFTTAVFAVCALILTPLVLLEWSTGQNPFRHLGTVETTIREGKYRCQAAFPHAIMLGVFWASLVPLFISMAKTGYMKTLFYSAVAACVFIVFASASSTPLAVLAVGLFFTFAYTLRSYAGTCTYALAVLLFFLHLVMNKPVWHLISRIDLIGGSTGWHRYHLIDQAIKHISQWAILGTSDTRSWGRGLQDITNQYILEGVRGGLITLVLFIAFLIVAIKGTYRTSLSTPDQNWKIFSWAICASLCVHAFSFLAVSYFGQAMMLLYINFALASFVYEDQFVPLTKISYYPQVAFT